MSTRADTPETRCAQPSVPEALPAARPRLAYIDNLRTALIAGVVLGHVAITYGGGSEVGQWYYHEAGELNTAVGILMTILMGIGMATFLGLFMFIAGYFTPRPYDRKGFGPFLLDRLVRLGIPLVIYAAIINPLLVYWVQRHGGYGGSLWQYAAERPEALLTAAVGPMWFLEALLIFSVLYAVGRRLVGRGAPPEPGRRTGSLPPGNRAIALFILALGLVTFVVRIWALVGWNWEPPHLELAHFPQYIAMFSAGIAAYRGDWLAGIPSAQARPWRWVALGCVLLMPLLAVAAGALSGELDPAGAGGLTWLSLAYSMWESFMCVSLSIAMLVWCRDRFNRQGKLARELSAAAYGVYVLHPLLIVPLALALSGIRLDLSLKFVVVAPVAVALCFLVAALVRRLPLVKRVL